MGILSNSDIIFNLNISLFFEKLNDNSYFKIYLIDDLFKYDF
jgi:hypothetical protein